LHRSREAFLSAGVRPRLATAVTYFLLARLKDREAAAALRTMEFSGKEMAAYGDLVPETEKALKTLKGRRTNAPKDAYFYLVTVPPERLAFLQAEYGNSKAGAKIRNYLQKWRPMRASLPMAELDALGVPRGPKFDKILEDFFEAQLRGKGRDPLERTKILKRLAGIKDEPKKKIEEKKKSKQKHKAAIMSAQAAAEAGKAPLAAPAEGSKGGKLQPPKAEATKPPAPSAAKAKARAAGKTAQRSKPAGKSRKR
jgi:hypothetical protein